MTSWHRSHCSAMRSLCKACAIAVTSPSICVVSTGISAGRSVGTMLLLGRRDRGRQRDLELDAGGNDAFLLQAVEQSPRLDRHVGIASLDGRRVEPRAWLHAQAWNFAQ